MKKWILILVFLFPVIKIHAATVTPLTLAEQRTRVRFIIKDTNSSRQKYTDSEINDLINEGVRDSAMKARVLKETQTITLSTTTTFYAFSTSSVLAIERVEYTNDDGDIVNIDETTMQELDMDATLDWRSAQGPPTHYFFDDKKEFQIGVFPVPDSSTGTNTSTGTLTVFTILDPGRMTSDSESAWGASSVRIALFYALVPHYAATRIFIIENEMEKAAAHKALYDEGVKTMTELGIAKPNYRPGFSSVRQ